MRPLRVAGAPTCVDENEPTMAADGSIIQPAELKSALRAYAGTGLSASTFDEEPGGGQLTAVL